MKDNQVLKHIENLVAEEEQLYTTGNLTDKEIKRLHQVKVELDQYWDYLRQRRALRDAGGNPADAEVRPEKIVEHYKR